jgi:hypothetical protein
MYLLAWPRVSVCPPPYKAQLVQNRWAHSHGLWYSSVLIFRQQIPILVKIKQNNVPFTNINIGSTSHTTNKGFRTITFTYWQWPYSSNYTQHTLLIKSLIFKHTWWNTALLSAGISISTANSCNSTVRSLLPCRRRGYASRFKNIYSVWAIHTITTCCWVALPNH